MSDERWSTHSEETDERIRELSKELAQLLPDPIKFNSYEEIENLTDDQANQVIREARRMLLMTLLGQETHEHWLDDCGDDLFIATENWNTLYTRFFFSDGQNMAEDVREWLDPRKQLEDDYDHTWGGVDGEIRFALLTDEMFEAVHEEQDRRHKEWQESPQGKLFDEWLSYNREHPDVNWPAFQKMKENQ